ATKRIFVVRKVLDEFLEKFVKKTKSLRVGDPFSPETDIGPMVREEALETLDGQVKEAVRQGAHLELGGERLRRKGSFYPLTDLKYLKLELRMKKIEQVVPTVYCLAMR